MKFTNLLLLLTLLLAAIGCGGGGVSGGGGTSGSGALFMTDSLDSHDHVWVTIKKVVLTGAGGNATVFDDTTGKTVDLRTLRDGSGERYSFLASTPSGTFTGVSVTLDKTVTLFGSGASTGLVREFAGNDGTNVVMTLNFAAPRSFGSNSGFALDFSLSDWTDNGTTVSGSPFLKEGNGGGLNDGSRHEHEDYEGTIQGLSGTAPDQTFTLTRGGRSIAVITSSSTIVFNSNGNPSPTLANGKRVEVRGAFDLTQNAIVADVVKIEDAGHGQGEAEVKGNASNINAIAGSLTVDATRTHHFQPNQSTVDVATTANTVYFSHGGLSLTKEEFFAVLANGQEVEAEGAYDSGSNTLTARKLKLEDHQGEHGHEAEIKGPVSNLNASSQTFDVNAVQWEGITLGANHLIHITVTAETRYEHDNMTAQQFFAALSNGSFLEVEGFFDAETSTLVAKKMQFED